jgi:hypothetical protein
MSKFLDELIVKKQKEIQRLVELNNSSRGKEGQAAAAAGLSYTLPPSRKNIRKLIGLH